MLTAADMMDAVPLVVPLDRDSVQLALWGLERYRPYLEEMKGLESRFQLDRSPVTDEMDRLDEMIKWCKERLSVLIEADLVSLSRRSLKWLKAGMLFKIEDLRQDRSKQFSMYPHLPVKLIEAINSRIAYFENLAETGPFNSLKPAQLAIDSVAATPIKVEVADATPANSEPSAVVMRVELLDPELRRRCGDLYEQFASDPTHQDRFDTVLRDASVIMESRIRQTTGLPENLIGESLLGRALAPETGELIFGDDKYEQKAIHHLFLGFFGFVRNSVNHRLVPTYTKERAAQVLGLADYLLFLVSRAERRHPPSEQNTLSSNAAHV